MRHTGSDAVSATMSEGGPRMTKAWWLGFPRLKCPHCGKTIEGIKFAGRFKLPRVKKEVKDGEDD